MQYLFKCLAFRTIIGAAMICQSPVMHHLLQKHITQINIMHSVDFFAGKRVINPYLSKVALRLNTDN